MNPPAPRRIEIVGGGLAGLSLGLALRRAGAPVTLHEAGAYPRHHVCGEFITGLRPEVRARLGLDAFLHDALLHREVAWLRAGRVFRRQHLAEPALALSRHTLDQRLAEAFVAAGGDLRTGSRLPPDDAPAGRVFATGRRADPASPWLGLKCHAFGLSLRAPLEMHLGDDAYVGLCAVEDGRVNVSGLFRRRPGLAFDRSNALPAHLRACGLDALADRLADVELDPASARAVSGLGYRCIPSSDTRLVVGDTRGLVPPFTGHGMAVAFESAALALDPLLAWSRGAADWPDVLATVRRAVRARFRLRTFVGTLLQPAVLRPPGQRLLVAASRAGVLPVNTLYRLTH